ncbi:hypothetical protein KY290_031450 [Solanum tuberosum]|uniref:DUF4283 domain-containing protein n=1 Tax=Solanum tuberosum TaxID=4113 RepID=A0ABQ7U974_SOLTU|nr:hypothetical protein KY290_031450 [Solanum tuberosum]
MRKLQRLWRGSRFLISFQPFFGKDSLFSLATAVGKPLQLDQATINQSRPSCAKVRVLVDLAANFPKAVVVNVLDEATGELKTDKITIKHDYIPKYCSECKLQGHDKNNCRILHPDLWNYNDSNELAKGHEVEEPFYPKIERLQKGNAKILSSGKIVGDPGEWKVIWNNKYNHTSVQKEKQQLEITNKYGSLATNESCESSNNNDIATNGQGVIPNSDRQTVEKN